MTDGSVSGDILHRERLVSLLDGESRLTFVCASAGAGKSTLLAEWLDARPDNSAIVVLAADDSFTTAKSMWLHILEQLAEDPAIAVADRDRLSDDLRGFASIRNASAVGQQTLRSITSPLTIVVDRAERIRDGQFVEDLLDAVAEPTRLRVIVATRRQPSPPELAHMLRLNARIIADADLAFTHEEALTVIRVISRQPAVSDAFGALGASPFSARLLGTAMRLGTLSPTDTHAAKAIVDQAYLDAFAFAGASAEMQRFFLESAIPDVATLDIAARLGWEANAATFFDEAEARGLGRWESRQAGRTFIYAPPFREALNARLEALSSERRKRAHRVVALWAAEQKRPLEAVTNALASGDYDLASRLGRQFWFPLSQDSSVAIIHTLRQLPVGTLIRYPTLATLMALTLVARGERARAYPYFRSAMIALWGNRDDPDDPSERLWLKNMQTLGDRYTGNFARSERAAYDVTAILARLNDRQHVEMETAIGLFYSNAGASLFYAGKWADAVEALEAGVRFRVEEDDGGWYHCASLLAGVYAFQGRMVDSRRMIATIDASDTPSHWRVDIFGIFEQFARTIDAIASHDLPSASAALESIAHQAGRTEHSALQAALNAWLLLAAGRNAEALRTVEQALERNSPPPTSDLIIGMLRETRSIVMLAQGRTLEAARRQSARSSLLAAYAALQERRNGDVIQLLGAKVGRTSTATNGHTVPAEKLMYAVAQLHRGSPLEAAVYAGQAIERLRAEDNLLPFVLFSEADLRAIRAIVEPPHQDVLDRHVAHRERSWPRTPVFPEPGGQVTLTPRELVVLRELSVRTSMGSIAQALSVSPNTVKAQTRSIYKKLDVRSRQGALVRAAELGLL